MVIFFFFPLFLLKIAYCCSTLSSASKCTGCPPTYNGLPCASTTRYEGTGSSCGCFDFPEGGIGFQTRAYTAAPNEKFLESDNNSTWCLRRCGECYRLTCTGGYVDTQGGPCSEGTFIVLMLTNACPIVGNTQWCSQRKSTTDCVRDGDCDSNTNLHGYLTHFDINNDNMQVNNLNWDNPEVTYERVRCPLLTPNPVNYPNTPSEAQWETCECFGQNNPYPFVYDFGTYLLLYVSIPVMFGVCIIMFVVALGIILLITFFGWLRSAKGKFKGFLDKDVVNKEEKNTSE